MYLRLYRDDVSSSPGPRRPSWFAIVVCASAMMMATTARADADKKQSGGALDRTTGSVGENTRVPPPQGEQAGQLDPQIYGPEGKTTKRDDAAKKLAHPRRRGVKRCVNCPSRLADDVVKPKEKPTTRFQASIELGLQSVHDSDGAAMTAIKLTTGRFRVGFDAIRYFEAGPAGDGSDSVHMNMWSVSGQGRVLHLGATSLWLQGGLVGTSSNQFEALSGVFLGGEVEHAFTSRFELYGGARYFMLDPDVRAHQWRGGVKGYFVTLGYRSFAFVDLGEALHGPEVGLSFRF